MHIFTPKGSMHFFTMGVVRPWPRLPREAVATPSLAVLKARLDGALRNLISGRCPCPWQRGWNWMIYKILSNPNHSMILCSESHTCGIQEFLLKNRRYIC